MQMILVETFQFNYNSIIKSITMKLVQLNSINPFKLKTMKTMKTECVLRFTYPSHARM